MKLFTSFTAIIAAASAGQIFSQPQADHYANAADVYQSAVEHQGVYAGQPHSFPGHAYSGQLVQQRPSAEKSAKILAYHSESNDHSYNYAYETENGIKAQEIGQVIKGTQAEGAFSYKGDDGHTYTVTYTADEHGFRPQGSHLPTPPPIPEAILKSLEENAKAEASGIYDDGHYHAEQQSAKSYQAEHQSAQSYQPEHQLAQSYQAQHQSAHSYEPEHQSAQSYQAQHQSAQSYQPEHQSAQSYQAEHQSSQSYQAEQQPAQSYQYEGYKQEYAPAPASNAGYHH